MANEKRVRLAFQSGTLGETLSDSGTEIEFDGTPDFATLASDEHIALIIDPAGADGDPEIVYITAYTALDSTATIVRAQEGTTAREHLSGTGWAHGQTLRDVNAGRIARARSTASNVTISSTSYVAVDTGTDLQIAAQAGDILEIGVSFLFGSESGSARVDAATMVSGSPVNYISGNGSGGLGVMAWIALPTGTSVKAMGSIPYEVVSGDVVAGVVTLRLLSKVPSSTRVIVTDPANGLFFFAKNTGPQAA